MCAHAYRWTPSLFWQSWLFLQNRTTQKESPQQNAKLKMRQLRDSVGSKVSDNIWVASHGPKGTFVSHHRYLTGASTTKWPTSVISQRQVSRELKRFTLPLLLLSLNALKKISKTPLSPCREFSWNWKATPPCDGYIHWHGHHNECQSKHSPPQWKCFHTNHTHTYHSGPNFIVSAIAADCLNIQERLFLQKNHQQLENNMYSMHIGHTPGVCIPIYL